MSDSSTGRWRLWDTRATVDICSNKLLALRRTAVCMSRLTAAYNGWLAMIGNDLVFIPFLMYNIKAVRLVELQEKKGNIGAQALSAFTDHTKEKLWHNDGIFLNFSQLKISRSTQNSRHDAVSSSSSPFYLITFVLRACSYMKCAQY